MMVTTLFVRLLSNYLRSITNEVSLLFLTNENEQLFCAQFLSSTVICVFSTDKQCRKERRREEKRRGRRIFFLRPSLLSNQIFEHSGLLFLFLPFFFAFDRFSFALKRKRKRNSSLDTMMMTNERSGTPTQRERAEHFDQCSKFFSLVKTLVNSHRHWLTKISQERRRNEHEVTSLFSLSLHPDGRLTFI